MYVCTSNASGGKNCGICEKCVRTRLHLLLAGVLPDAGAFAGDDVSEGEIRAVRIQGEGARVCFEDALPRLRQRGRPDLVAAVERIVADHIQSAGNVQAKQNLLRRATRKAKQFFTR